MAVVSVILPVYNAAQYLQQCLDSVIMQSLQDIELICVDDGSTDNSYKILQEYAKRDSRITVLQQQNAGAGSARNLGIQTAQGEYIHFLDADDYLALDAYEKLYAAAKQYDADFVKAKAYCFDNTTNQPMPNAYYELLILNKGDFNRACRFADAPEKFSKIAVVPWNGIYKRAFLLQHNITFNLLPCVNDRSFYNQVLISARCFAIIDAHVVYYRVNNDNSLIGKRGEYFYCHFDSYRVIEKQCELLSDYEKAVILNTELTDIFVWYKRLQQNHQITDKIYQQMVNFAKSLDIEFILQHELFCEWYDDYCELLGIPYKRKYLINRIIQQCKDKGIRYFLKYFKYYGLAEMIKKVKERG